MAPSAPYFWFLDEEKFELSYCYAGQWVVFQGPLRSIEVWNYQIKCEMGVFSKHLTPSTFSRVVAYKGIPLHDVVEWRQNYYDRQMTYLSIRTNTFTLYESHDDP